MRKVPAHHQANNSSVFEIVYIIYILQCVYTELSVLILIFRSSRCKNLPTNLVSQSQNRENSGPISSRVSDFERSYDSLET